MLGDDFQRLCLLDDRQAQNHEYTCNDQCCRKEIKGKAATWNATELPWETDVDIERIALERRRLSAKLLGMKKEKPDWEDEEEDEEVGRRRRRRPGRAGSGRPRSVAARAGTG